MKLIRKAVSGIILMLLFMGTLTLAFNIQLIKAEPETVRVDNLIVTSSDLEAAATRLAQWKNSCGIPSKVLNVTWIYSHYSGVDGPEKIRNCIKDFHSNFQTKYVTIFGDTDKVPIRYAYVPDNYETYVPTDLYYADLDFTWDDNGDGLYADLDHDSVDGVPDVYVGRIPPSFIDKADDVVTKIIQYKQYFDASEDWVSRVVLAAGVDDGLEGATTSISEYISDVVNDKNIVKLYESAGNLTNHALDYEIDKGCIFLNFAGHSREEFWSSESWVLRWLIWSILPEVYSWEDALDRTNGRKLPVIVTMSCLSAKVDEQECIGEYFVLNPDGGAIAYFGSTGVAWCYVNGSAPYGLMGEMDRRIFEAFYDGYTKLGDMWGVALTKYLLYNPLDYFEEGNGYLNEKTVMEFILLGDPTLRIGTPLDTTPPVTTITLNGVLGQNDWFTSDVTVTLSATDDICGVDKTEYSFNNVAWTSYTKPFTVAKEGNTILYYRSTDKDGNIEMIKIKIIKIDKTAPYGSIVLNNDDAYTTSISVTLTLTATDTTSGVYQVRFSNDGVWDTEPWETPSPTKAWTLTSGDGSKTVYFQIKDNAGLTSPSYQDTIILDTTRPSANAGQDQTVKVGTTVTFDAGASTDNVGIVSYEWNFGDGTTGTGITTTHTYTSAGTYTVTLTVKDAAGNTASHSITVTVVSAEAFPMWIVGAAAAIAAIGIAIATTILWKKRKQT